MLELRNSADSEGKGNSTKMSSIAQVGTVLLFVFGLLCAIAPIAESKTYYVSRTGSDNFSGLETEPFLTIQKAADLMVPGDTVMVQAGTYPERVSTRRTGTEGKLISFQANGEVVVTGGFAVNTGHNYIKINGFTIAGETSAYLGFIQIEGSYCQATNNKITYTGTNSIYGIRLSGSPAYCVIAGNTLSGLHYPNIQLVGIGHVVENNTIQDTPHDAMRIFGHDHVVKNNLFQNVNSTSLTHTDLFQTFGNSGNVSYNVLVENNYARNCAAQIGNFEQAGAADVRDWTFRNNVFENIDYSTNIYAPGFKFYNNTFYRVSTNLNGPLVFNSAAKGIAHQGEVFNNLFIGCGNYQTGSSNNGWYVVVAGVEGFRANYNYITTDGPDFALKPNFGGKETDGINGGDPLFFDIARSDFRLKPGSPAAGKGAILTGFTTDKDGVPRSQDRGWAIGAYEPIRLLTPPTLKLAK